ncbi:Protein transport protein SFT2 [Eumeta japonica]|uniref:Vesicle transport protein n=1 Tax=Eumeta variegata TaxID=151549 RepID=A0A4C1ZZG8_EUMVA|nr:Protein transport protein SFT2 [Eumeta japonica]
MANLKSDLDEYLLSNENRRGFKFSLPKFSTPSFLSRSTEETPSSTKSGWFDEVQKEYFTLSRTQSFSFLYGPWTHIKSMFSKERVLTTVIYGGTLIATLYCALHLQSTLLTIVCAVSQVLALSWMMLGSIPGGSSGARVFGSMFKSSVSSTLPV